MAFKWTLLLQLVSKNGLRRTINASRTFVGLPRILVFDGTLDECITKFLEQPAGQRHLYEIHTAPQGELIPAVISSELAAELARLRDFL